MFQPVILAGMAMIAISLSVAGAITTETLKLYVLGLPALLAGLWLGFKCYGKLDDATFRKLVLVLLLCSGLALIAAQRWRSRGSRPPSVVSTLVIACCRSPRLPASALACRKQPVGNAPSSVERQSTASVSVDASNGETNSSISSSDSCAQKKIRSR